MKKPLISIIVPCYNQAQYLDECLQSVLDQTYNNWECIIVNDGSSDPTDEIAKKWLEKDERFKYLYKENGGIASARNTGIEQAQGEWILPLDSDDKIENQYLEFAEQEFDKGYSIIYCKADFFGEREGDWELHPYSFEKMLLSNKIFCSAFFRKKDWKKVDGYDSQLIYGFEDWEFWIAILDENKLVYRLPYLGFHYRRKKESRDVEVNREKFKFDHSRKHIYFKHYEKYSNYFGDAFELIRENRELKYNNQFLQKLVNEPLLKKIKRKLFK